MEKEKKTVPCRYCTLDECQAGDGLDGDDHRGLLSDQLSDTAVTGIAVSYLLIICQRALRR
jgi:hypothetical protein